MMTLKNICHSSRAHRRETNQDHCFFLEYNGSPQGEAAMSILCVLDGVSGANGGEAVRIAAPAMMPELASLLGKAHSLLSMDNYSKEDIILGAMVRAIRNAQDQLQSTGYHCGTTATIVTVFDGIAYAANVGDSPAYLLEIPPLGGAVQLTPLFQCHNEAGEALQRGELTPEEARNSPLRNRLMRMVGSIDFLPGDIYTTTEWLGQQNLLLLGSDGALSVLPEEVLLELAADYPVQDPELLIQRLYQKICSTRSTDNFTVLAQGVDTE